MTDLLTTSGAAELVGVSRETMRQWAKDGRIRHVVLPSGQLRFRREDIDAILRPVEPTEAVS